MAYKSKFFQSGKQNSVSGASGLTVSKTSDRDDREKWERQVDLSGMTGKQSVGSKLTPQTVAQSIADEHNRNENVRARILADSIAREHDQSENTRSMRDSLSMLRTTSAIADNVRKYQIADSIRREHDDAEDVRGAALRLLAQQITDEHDRSEIAQPTVGERIGNAAKSIGKTMWYTPGVIADTAKQYKSDIISTDTDQRVASLRKENESLAGQLEAIQQGYGNAEWGTEDEIRSKIRENVAAINSLRTSNPVSLNTKSMQGIGEAIEHAQQATSGMTGWKKDFADAGISIGQNLASMPLAFVNPNLVLGSLGSQSAAQRMYELSAQGVGAQEAFARGLVSGSIEVLTEKLPLDNLVDMVGSGNVRNFAVNILKQAGLEGTEEGVSYVLNYAADKLANDPNAEFSVDELVQNVKLGAISGGFFGVGGTAVGGIANYAYQRQDADTQRAESVGYETKPAEPAAAQESPAPVESIVDRAMREQADRGSVSNSTAEAILADSDAMDLLGVRTDNSMTKSQQRTAVKEAVRSRQNAQESAYSETGSYVQSDTENAVQAEKPRTVGTSDAAREVAAAVQETPLTREVVESDLAALDAARGVLGENGAKSIRALYDGRQGTIGADELYRSYLPYYEAGVNGRDVSTVDTRYRGVLNEVETKIAYEAGQMDAAKSLREEQAAAPGVIVYDKKTAGATAQTGVKVDRNTMRTLDGAAKALGVKIVVEQQLEGGANGYIRNGEIHISASAQNPILVVAAHEITHRMQEMSPKAYREYRDYVMNALSTARGGSVASLVQSKIDTYQRSQVNAGRGQALTAEQAMDELAADFTREMMHKTDLFDRFSKQNRTAAQKLLDSVRSFIRKVKSLFPKNRAAQNAAAQAEFGTDMDILVQAEKLWSKAIISAQSIENKITHNGLPVKKRFSLSDPVEQTGTLLAVHNKDWGYIRDAVLNWGGIPSPSIAIVEAEQGHTAYGDTSVIYPRSTIDPQADKRNKVYGSDAWTPTHSDARIEYEVDYDVKREFQQNIELLARDVAGGIFAQSSVLDIAGVGDQTEMSLQDIAKKLANRYDSVRAAYLSDKGGDIEIVYRTKEFDSFGNDALRSFIDKVGEQETARLAAKMMTGERLSESEIEMAKDAIIEHWTAKNEWRLKKNPELRDKRIARQREKLSDLRAEDFVRNAWDFYEDSGATTDEVDRMATAENLRHAVDTKAVENWALDMLQGLLGEPGIYNGKELFDARGNRKSFRETHWAYTAENIVRAMNNAKDRGQGMWGVSGEGLVAMSTPSYRSVDEIHADEGRLRTVDQDTHEQLMQQLNDELERVTSDIMRTTEHHSDNRFDEEEIIGEVIALAAQGKRTAASVKQTFRKEGYAITDQQAQSILAILSRAGSVPSGYFEAKPQRVVGFEEAVAVIAPDTIPASEVDAVRNAGVNVIQYESGNNRQRMEIANSLEGVRFSISEDSDGRELTEEQKKYFSGTKAVDQNGRLLTLYHGTRKGGFTVFRDWAYLTESKKYARRYADNDTGETVYEVYANIQKPFDTRLEECREIWEQEFYGSYSRTDLQESGLPDWTDGYDLVDFLEENGYDYDAILLDEGAEPDGSGGVVERGISYVVRSSEQIKNVSNKTPTSDRDIRRSVNSKNEDDLHSVTEQAREINRLRTQLERAREQTRRTGTYSINKRKVSKSVRELFDRYSSDLYGTETESAITKLYSEMEKSLNRGSVDYDELRAKARQIAEQIATASEETSDDAAVYTELRKTLRSTGISISDADKADIPDFNSFRKRNFGRLKITKDGMPVDEFYVHLSEAFPEFFDHERETHPAEQLQRIAEVYEEISGRKTRNLFGDDIDSVIEDITSDIIGSFFTIPHAKQTFADRQAGKLGAARADAKQAKAELAELTRQYDRDTAALEKTRSRALEALEETRTAHAREVQKLRDRFAERTKAGRERQNERELRNKIKRHVDKLSRKLLQPTDQQHVPETLRPLIAKALASIDLSSKNGRETKRTQAFLELRSEYAKIAGEDSGMVVDPDLLAQDGLIDQVARMGDTRIADMNGEQLQTVWKTVRALEHAVVTAGKLLAGQKYAGTAAWADALAQDTKSFRVRRTTAASYFATDLETPYTFFSHYGEAGKAIYRMLRDAQDEQQVKTDRIAAETAKLVDGKTVRKLQKETHRFDVDGRTLTLTTAHIMELYELSKREQAQEHLMRGGIVQPEIKSAKVERGTESIPLSLDQIAEIVGTLTDDQKRIADGLQKMMSTTLADWGNEASMKAYGYKKFTGTDYWPIHSASEGVHQNAEKSEGNARSIKNIGMAKNTIPHASNALDISGVFQTFAGHAADMIDYSTWLCPMEDANRLLNYQYRDENGVKTGQSVMGMLNRYGGQGAQKYWKNLMNDIQNGIKTNEDTRIGRITQKLYSNVKGAAVGANVRVIIQQPTAILRAMTVLDPQYLLGGIVKGKTGGSGWEKAVRYAPIAARKAQGGFDVKSQSTMSEILFDDKSVLSRSSDFLSSGAAKADEITWGRIWNACERQVKAQDKKIDMRTDAFNQKVAELFTEVIDQTQVVDGVLQRSQAMRSSNQIVQQATSFMGEPTQSLNIFLRAWDGVRRESDPKKAAKAVGVAGRAAFALICTDVVNALAQSLVDALRDDDEDKKYLERVWSAFTGITGDEEEWTEYATNILFGNLGSNMNPAGRIPVAKDALSILQGYTVERMDTSGLADFIAAAQDTASLTGNGKKTQRYAVKQLVTTGSKLFGISAANLLRDVWAIARSVAIERDDNRSLYAMQKQVFRIGDDRNKKLYLDLAFKAQQDGDSDVVDEIADELISLGILDDREQFDEALYDRLEKKYMDTDEYEQKYSETLNAIGNALDQTGDYMDRGGKFQSNAMKRAKSYAKSAALRDVDLNGELSESYDDLEKYDEAIKYGLTPDEMILFDVAYLALLDEREAWAESHKDEKPETTRKEDVIDMLEEMAWLTDEERSYLYISKGYSEKNNPF